jgi:hypothetical protein
MREQSKKMSPFEAQTSSQVAEISKGLGGSPLRSRSRSKENENSLNKGPSQNPYSGQVHRSNEYGTLAPGSYN